MNIVQPFFKQCSDTPDALAFSENETAISYANFKNRVETLGLFLQKKLIADACIAIALDRGIDSAVCIYGVLSAGAIYVPLDIKNPAVRLNFIIEDAQARYIIGSGKAPEWLEQSEKWLDMNEIFQQNQKAFMPVELEKTQIAAILYTSGSTGTPKGVALSHQALFNFSAWATETFSLNNTDCIASLAPFHFDLSIFDLFSSLSVGASVHFIPDKLSFSPSKLTAWLSERKISCWYTVPSLLSFIALKGAVETTDLSALKRILFAGEVFPMEHLITLSNLLPDVDLYNLYGPTETNVCCYWKVDRARLKLGESIPIGKAAGDAVLDVDSATGELRVQSLNNFSGYWQNGKLSALASSPYLTGDKVSLNSRGEYCYHGRLDRMLKCSGYRVEPAEIEQRISQLEGIAYCAVIGMRDKTSGQRPAAVLVLENGVNLAAAIKPLRGLLPSYMQPCKFITVDTLPTLSNGKIDYLAIEGLFH